MTEFLITTWLILAFGICAICAAPFFSKNARQQRANESIRLKIQAAQLRKQLLTAEGRQKEMAK